MVDDVVRDFCRCFFVDDFYAVVIGDSLYFFGWYVGLDVFWSYVITWSVVEAVRRYVSFDWDDAYRAGD